MVSLIKRWEVLGGTNTLCSLTFLHKYIILTKALTGGKDLSFSYTQKILVISKAGEVHPKFAISSVVKILVSSSKNPCFFCWSCWCCSLVVADFVIRVFLGVGGAFDYRWCCWQCRNFHSACCFFLYISVVADAVVVSCWLCFWVWEGCLLLTAEPHWLLWGV